MLGDLVGTCQHAMNHGGFVMVPLLLIATAMWWAIGDRAFTLFSPRLLLSARQRLERYQPLPASVACSAVARSTWSFLAVADLELELGRGRTLVRTLVLCAPLLGLLGTVTGMIETFDALAEMALYRRSGGVAGGVAQALLSTQVGLCVAVPGLILGRLLDRREKRLSEQLDAVRAGGGLP